VIISPGTFPSGLALQFTPDVLVQSTAAHLSEVIGIADSSVPSDWGRQEGLGPRPVKQQLLPVSALANTPSPIFDQKWKGLGLNLARKLGMSLRAKRYIDIEVLGLPQGGWRLLAFRSDSPQYDAVLVASAPGTGGPCTDPEACIDDLAEQTLQSLDAARLLNYYIKLDANDADKKILGLYQHQEITAEKPEDLVAWGNAFSGLGQYPDALQKYEEALEPNGSFCPAHIAIGLAYYNRPHGTRPLPDILLAEKEFRSGVQCDEKNVFAQTNLCSVLVKEWAISPHPDPGLLTEANDHCDSALAINPRFVAAAVIRGYVLYRQGKSADALSYFEDISQKYPTNSNLLANYGFLLYLEYLKGNADDLARAIDETKSAWDLDNASFPAANNLGFLYYEQGYVPQAVKFWKAAKLLNGDRPDCLAGLAIGLYKLNQQTEAFAMLASAVHLDSHYNDPAYLKANENWSDRAVSDLMVVIQASQTAGNPVR
jgi:tetratricopeptide (TPR) repeat protein